MTIWELIALAKSIGKGSMFHFKGAVNTINDLPETGEDGDVYLVDSEDSYFAWDGEGWTDIGQILTADDAAELFNQLEDAGDQQVARVQQKGAEVLESIPEDYTDLSDDVDNLKSALYGEYVAVSLPVTTNDKYYLGAVGESITTNDGTGFIYSAIDLTEHIGKYVVLTLTSPNTTSQRICAMCDSTGVIKDRYREKDIIDNSGVVQFAITADQKYLYMSFGKNAVVDVKIKNVPSIIEEIDTVYVSTTGNDINDGSKSFPFATIAKALSTGAEFIKVFAGQYAGFGIQSRNKPVQIALAEMNTFNDDSLNKIEITSGYSAQHAIMIQDAVSVKLSDIYVHGLPGNCFYFSQVENIECVSCHASTNSGTDTMGFAIRYSNGKFIDCEADHVVKDGFNIHGFGDTVFINCKGHDNGDDGISHHDGSTGYIQGGEYYNNNKGGIISPYGGSVVSIDGAVCHDNARYGIFAGYLDSTYNTSRGCVSNCVMKNNGTYDFYIGNCTLKAWDNIYATKEVNNANFTEYQNSAITRNSFPLTTGFAVRITNGYIATVNSENWNFVAIPVEPGIDFDITTKIYGSTYYDVLIADLTGKVIAQHQTAGSNMEIVVNYTGTIVDKSARILYVNTRAGYTPEIVLKTNASAITTAINRTQNTSITVGCANCGAYNHSVEGEPVKTDAEYLENWKLMLESCGFDVFNVEDSAFTGVFTQANIYDPVVVSAHHSQQNDIHTESRIEVIDATYVTLPSTVTVDGVTYSTNRYRGLCCRCMMGDKSVGIYAVHLAPSAGQEPMRKAQFDALIAHAARFDEAIFTGDFNCQAISEYQPFIDAGYAIGNGGYFGTFLTLRDIPADNIIVSNGLIITSFHAITDYVLNTDHRPIIAKIRVKA